MRSKLQRFGEVLDETSRLQQESCAAVRSSVSGARSALEDLRQLQTLSRETLTGLAGYAQQLTDARRQADDAYMRVASSVEQMELVSRQQNNYLKTVSTMQSDLSRIVDAMHIQANKQLQEEFGSTMDAYRDYVNQFTQRVDYLASNISGALRELPDAVSEANNRFLDQVDRMTDAMVQGQRALEDAADRLYRG